MLLLLALSKREKLLLPLIERGAGGSFRHEAFARRLNNGLL